MADLRKQLQWESEEKVKRGDIKPEKGVVVEYDNRWYFLEGRAGKGYDVDGWNLRGRGGYGVEARHLLPVFHPSRGLSLEQKFEYLCTIANNETENEYGVKQCSFRAGEDAWVCVDYEKVENALDVYFTSHHTGSPEALEKAANMVKVLTEWVGNGN